MWRSLATIAVLLACTPAKTQDFPTRPVQIIVPASPAGITDIAARIIGDGLTRLWGRQVVIENRPGGGGTIGVLSATRAAPDGHTLLMTTNGELALAPAITSKVPYSWERDLKPIVMATRTSIVVAANSESPFRSVRDVVAAARAKPGEIAWASPGVGTWNHLTGAWLADALGLKLLHVPYKGGGPAGTALAAGDVPLGIIAVSSALPHVQAGRVRVLALTSTSRSALVPSWPTVAEEFATSFDAQQWVGLFAPAGLEDRLRDRLERDVLAVLAMPDVKDRFEKVGVEVAARPGSAAAAQLKIDVETASRISEKAGMRIE